MKRRKFSMNQANLFWRNLRLTITTILFPVIGLIFVLYETCKPFRLWADRQLNKIFNNMKGGNA